MTDKNFKDPIEEDKDSIVWDNLYDEYSTDQYPPFGGPFTDSIPFIEWLKKYYHAPERRKNS